MIGIVGCSAEGAALCLRTICAEGPALFGPHAHPEVALHVASLAAYVRCLDAGDLAGVGALMLTSARKLVGAGADVLICPDNTIHAAFAHVAPHLTRPWLHIADVVADAAAGRGARRVGLLGTRWLVESDVYPPRLATRGIACVLPPEADRALVHRLIMEVLVPGHPPAASTPALAAVIARLAADGCDAVILGCTELPLAISDATSPLPTLDSTRLLARAALAWTRHPPAPGSATLARLHAIVTTTPLKITAKGSTPHHTAGFIALLFAYGYARLGERDRARGLVAEARTALNLADPVHGWLVAAYEVRIDQALARLPAETPLPDALVAQHAALNGTNLERYKVDRLRETSRILEPIASVDAMGAFIRKTTDGRGADVARLAGLAPAARPAEIARLIEYAATGTEEDERLLGAAYDHLYGLDPAAALPIWTRATALVAEAPRSARAALYTRALVSAAYFQRLAEVAPALVPALCEALADAPVGPLGWSLARVLPLLQRHDRHDDVERLAAVATKRQADAATDVVARAALAGANAWLGDASAAWRGFAALDQELERPGTSAVCRAQAWVHPTKREDALVRLAWRLPTICDTFGTSSHFSLSILDWVEGLVIGASGG